MAIAVAARRSLLVSLCISLLLLGFLCAGGRFDMQRFDMIRAKAVKLTEHKVAEHKVAEHKPAEGKTEKPNNPSSGVKTSRLHYLLPASKPSLAFCYHLASALANRYPVPMLIGWNGKGEFDAAVTHLAKLRALKRYLDALDIKKEGDDLVIFLDGYDVIHQLPPEIVIERYFEIAAKENARLAERFGLSVKEAEEKGLKQTVFLGPDKICFPIDDYAPRCWAVPPSSLGVNPFGTSDKHGDWFTNDPRYLNSGTIIGPVTDLIKVVDDTLEEIRLTFDEGYDYRNADQYYLSNIFARQEYWRNQTFLGDHSQQDKDSGRSIPEKRNATQDTELHMALEYESAIFQTRTGNDQAVDYLQYNLEDQSTSVKADLFDKGSAFRPYPVKMPDNVRAALMALYNSIPEAHPKASAEQWIKFAHLGTNLVTKHIYALWHNTGDKASLGPIYSKMWFYPFVKSLLRKAVELGPRNDPLSTKLIDGRRWVAKWPHPKNGGDEYGGAWSDESKSKFVPWKELCQEHESTLFWGQQATGM